MAAKLIGALVVAVLVAQGQCVTEVWLPDETTTYLSNPHIAKSISIPKWFFDTQVSCHLIMPNGAMHELYPTNTLVHDYISSANAAQPYNGCAAFFLNAPSHASGTYELLSVIDHTMDNSRTLTRQRFHLTFIESDTEWVVPQKGGRQ